MYLKPSEFASHQNAEQAASAVNQAFRLISLFKLSVWLVLVFCWLSRWDRKDGTGVKQIKQLVYTCKPIGKFGTTGALVCKMAGINCIVKLPKYSLAESLCLICQTSSKFKTTTRLTVIKYFKKANRKLDKFFRFFSVFFLYFSSRRLKRKRYPVVSIQSLFAESGFAKELKKAVLAAELECFRCSRKLKSFCYCNEVKFRSRTTNHFRTFQSTLNLADSLLDYEMH